MEYRFSKLATITDNDGCITIESHVIPSISKLFEAKYINEFRTLWLNNGTDQILSKLEQELYEQKVLIRTDEDEITFLEKKIIEIEKMSYGLNIMPTEDNSTSLSQAHYSVLA